MADKKISALNNATTPLTGAELVPLVQGGTTLKATVAQILSPAAGAGINFAANGGDTLTQYDEGTWAPDEGSGLTVVGTFSSSGKYTRVGRMVVVQGVLSATTSITISSATSQICSNLPFLTSGAHCGTMSNGGLNQSGGVVPSGYILYAIDTMSATTNIIFTVTYQI